MKIPFFSQRQNKAALSVPADRIAQQDPADIILEYHEETKHHYHRFARSLGYLDWDNQPNPFRRFEGSPLKMLPLLPISESPSYASLFNPQNMSPEPVDVNTISRFFRNSLAISAWKRQLDAHWSLRVNPSSGNLHPTEGYLILPKTISEIDGGVYHYAPREHALEQRAKFNLNFAGNVFFVGLSSIHWRESWKYGERAFRYCQHDAGHAIAALRISAGLLGWRLVVLDEFGDQQVSQILGLDHTKDFDQAEDEHPICIAAVVLDKESINIELDIDAISKAEWMGHANLLSESHVEWQIIDLAAAATIKEPTPIVRQLPKFQSMQVPETYHLLSAEKIIQQRRSCLSLDGVTFISSDTFYSMMQRVGSFSFPFDALARSELRSPRIHLAIFVHRVRGLDPGLYFLVRNPAATEDLKAAMNSKFKWEGTESPGLYLLEAADFRARATGVACGQDIGGEGVFSLAMIAEFEEPIRVIGPWMYRRLFWEAGYLGQILYLEAEAAGIRATGIGCYFDDPMHELLGLQGRQFQDLYHFTMGGPLEDERLTTEPAYER
jgi:SagB-type dehydrogenase family enzyme